MLGVDRLDRKIAASLPPQAPVGPNRGSLSLRDLVTRGIKGRDGRKWEGWPGRVGQTPEGGWGSCSATMTSNRKILALRESRGRKWAVPSHESMHTLRLLTLKTNPLIYTHSLPQASFARGTAPLNPAFV